MPSKKQYDLVQNDEYDSRIPLHPDEAFHHGITFQVKYIGMLDVPRPTSRVEIVAAMRRIRYEFKTKGIKKKKVTVEVSVDGVKVSLRKKKRRKSWMDDGKNVLLSHPIYRIFYVSHDSQDLKIFSYIARDGASNVFKCAVFKSNKKSQAMRVVRTIGQAFEVCHKLSITAPEQDNLDQDEQDTLTQDLISDCMSECDKHKKDLISEGASDKMSFTQDDNSTKGSTENKKNSRPAHLDMLPPPPNVNSNKKSPLTSAETYSSPHSDVLMSGGSGSGGSTSLPPAGSALSAHHELQLLREQLEQQNQQTQAAMAQLQLAREQLAAEQSARLEAQARTHQLLVHNRELLDHIAALVAHLQDGEKVTNQPQSSPHVAMPQHQQADPGNYLGDLSDSLDHSPVLQALGLGPQGLIENRAATSCLPPSPLRTYNPAGNVFTYNYPPQDASFEAQLLQRLQTLIGYSPPTYPYGHNLPFFQPGLFNPNAIGSSYTLQQPPQKKMPSSPLTMRNSYSGSPVTERRVSPGRNFDNQHQQNQQKYQNYPQQQQSNHLQIHQQQNVQQNQPSPQQQRKDRVEDQFIKPLPQVGTLTTTDTDGHVRVIVPVPANPLDDAQNLLASLRMSDDLRPFSGPGNITRSSSERVPNRSEMMSQVQRTAWARHTTK